MVQVPQTAKYVVNVDKKLGLVLMTLGDLGENAINPVGNAIQVLKKPKPVVQITLANNAWYVLENANGPVALKIAWGINNAPKAKKMNPGNLACVVSGKKEFAAVLDFGEIGLSKTIGF